LGNILLKRDFANFKADFYVRKLKNFLYLNMSFSGSLTAKFNTLTLLLFAINN